MTSTLPLRPVFSRLLTIGVISLATGCLPPVATVQAVYESSLIEVARPKATKARWGAVERINLDSTRYVYEDSMVKIIIVATDQAIPFSIRNKTDHSIKLVWDEASFIDPNGKVAKVMHEGVKFAERNASQPPSIIPAHQQLEDAAFPNDRVYYREGTYTRYGAIGAGWKHSPLIVPTQITVPGDATGRPQQTGELTDFVSKVTAMQGRRFGLVLPLQIEGETNEYTFWFQIKTAKVPAMAN